MPLLCRRTFPLPHCAESFYHHGWWILPHAFSASSDNDHIMLIRHFIYVVYHVHWYLNIEPTLYLENKPHLVTVYYPINVLLDLGCWYFVEGFASVFIRDVGMWLYCFVVCLSGESGWWWPREMNLWRSLLSVVLGEWEASVPWTFGGIHRCRHLVCRFGFITDLVSWRVVCAGFLFLLESVLEDGMYISRNWSICSRLSSLLAYTRS